MTDQDNNDILIASAKIAKAAKDAADMTAEAVNTAKQLIKEAATTAASLVTEQRANTTQNIIDALEKVFDDKVDSSQFIDVRKIPLICLKIVDINKNIDEIKDTLKWVSRLVIGAVVTGLVGLLFLAIKSYLP